jgi:hypothetical protein
MWQLLKHGDMHGIGGFAIAITAFVVQSKIDNSK